MTDETIVAVFDAASRAEAAVADLRAARVPEDAITLHAGRSAAPRGQGFWASLFGGEPEHDTAAYDHSIRQGSTVLTVRTPSEHVDRVMQLLERHQPLDMEDRATGDALAPSAELAPLPLPAPMPATMPGRAPRYEDADVTREEDVDATRHNGTRMAVSADERTDEHADARGNGRMDMHEDGRTDGRADADEVVPLASESLEVGRRVVNRGGTRVRRYVVETPVERSVTLRDEHVTLDRHPVADGRPVADDAFADKVVEMVETAEEAVVSKSARVVEEVNLRRRADERVETVRDTVRRQEVAVERIPGTAATHDDLPPRPRAPSP